MIKANIPTAVQHSAVLQLVTPLGELAGFLCGFTTEQPAWRPGLLFGYNLANKLDPNCNQLHGQTIGRCKAAARAFHDREVHDIFIVCRIENGDMKMANLMRDCLTADKVPADRIHVADPGFNTNTATEIQVFLEVLGHMNLPANCRTEIVFHSSWYHTKRIRMMFKHFGAKVAGWSRTSKGGVWDTLSEAGKLLLFWAIPGFGKRYEKIELPRWVTDPAVAEGATPVPAQA
jgi:hypothetical protein